MALPTLTHTLGSWQTVATPSSNTAIADAVEAAVDELDLAGVLTKTNNGTGYVEFGHATGPITAMRYVLHGLTQNAAQLALSYTTTTIL